MFHNFCEQPAAYVRRVASFEWMKRIRKHERDRKSQLGQFLTPEGTARKIVASLKLYPASTVLEPGCGDGAFVIPLIDRFLEMHEGKNIKTRLDHILNHNIWAVEMDVGLYQRLRKRIEEKYGYCPAKSNLLYGDFLHQRFDLEFDFSTGNPPFGATIDLEHQDAWEKVYGRRDGHKIKKESYSWFVLKALDHLRFWGGYSFICSDSFLTIKTMDGLRRYLVDHGSVEVDRLDYFSEETDYPMVLIRGAKGFKTPSILLDGNPVYRKHMEMTGNFSWTITEEDARYFDGPKLGDYVVCTGGMTTGKNEYFVREVKDGKIEETHRFEFFEDPITLERERSRARLNKLSPQKEEEIRQLEANGVTRKNVRITPLDKPEVLKTNAGYKPYNKATREIIYAPTRYAIYWKNDGEAVKTFKRNGNWYLHGIGGMPYFGLEGLTWNLVASRLKMRYLPEGYILDSGAPCGFLKDGVAHDELYFIIGWGTTDLATRLLKSYVNHTQNIQGKDVERLPYPFWVGPEEKVRVIDLVESLIVEAEHGREIRPGDEEIVEINNLFVYNTC